MFISNSTKLSAEKADSRDPIVMGNVRRPCIKAAIDLGYKVFLGLIEVLLHCAQWQFDGIQAFVQNVDLIENGKGGYLEVPKDYKAFVKDITSIAEDIDRRNNTNP